MFKRCDFIIEGFVDPSKLRIEGPFGDHTGYYTLEEEYPFMEVTAITSKKNPTYLCNCCWKTAFEDKYMGHANGIFFYHFKNNCT